MYYTRSHTRKTAAVMLAALISGFVIQIIPMYDILPGSCSVFIFSPLTLAWALTVRRRILHKRVRRSLTIAALLLINLFASRFCRWECFDGSTFLDRYMWYIYYISFVSVPLLSFYAAYNVGKDESETSPCGIKLLFAADILITLLIFTNDIHHSLLFFVNDGAGDTTARHRWLYFVVVAWSAVLFVSSFVILMKRCRLSACRSRWIVPAIPMAVFTLLGVWYYINGGSPELYGRKLFFIQEIYALLFVLTWEGFIQIGFVRSNTDYRELFRLSHLEVSLKDSDGETVYRSVISDEAPAGRSVILRTNPIAGGYVEWCEDVTAIKSMELELEDALARIEEENFLIEEEHRVTAERIRYDTQNRLYDSIAEHTRSQLNEIAEAIDAPEELELRMKFCLVLGAYVKRTANIMLIAHRELSVPSDELCLALSESFEYLSLFGIDCELKKGLSVRLPAARAVAVLDLFEALLENSMSSVSAVLAEIMPEDTVLMRLTADTEPFVLTDTLSGRIAAAGLSADMRETDDGIVITLCEGGDRP